MAELMTREWLDGQKTELSKSLGIDLGKPGSAQSLKAAALLRRLDERARDLSPQPVIDQFKFNKFQADTLLGEAAALLDRALADRAEHHRLGEQLFSVWLSLQEFAWLDTIHKEEEEKGFYDLAYQRSAAEVDAATNAADSLASAAAALSYSLENYHSEAELKRLSALQGDAAWASLSTDPSRKVDVVTGPAGNNGTAANIAYASNKDMTSFSILSQSAATLSQVRSMLGEVNTHRKRLAALTAQAEYDKLDIDFRKRRTEASRQAIAQKMLATQQAGGALNYLERMRPIEARFLTDVNHALARLEVVASMLSNLFGFEKALPTFVMPDVFDALVSYVREATNFVGTLATQAQVGVMSVSIRTLINRHDERGGDTAWKEGQQRGYWSVQIDESLFPNQRHIRLRGVQLFAQPGAGDGAWRLWVRCPKKGYTTHLNSLGGRRIELDQSELPEVLAGRVLERTHPRVADLVGNTVFHNASPIGEWTVRFDSVSNDPDATPAGLEDVHLDIFFVSVPTT